MITIDGSYGEGGGQTIRTAVALSAIIGEPIKMENIRANRPRPGLAAQHLNAIKTAAEMCSAELVGADLGSTSIIFTPGSVVGGSFNVDVGTAGSITLVLQCIMPIALHAPEAAAINIRGGTDVKWSPPIDFTAHVLLPVLKEFSIDAEIGVIARGYYPEGGGNVKAVIRPGKIKPAVIIDAHETGTVRGISHSSRLPEHVVQRQSEAARKHLADNGYANASITNSSVNVMSTGCGITLWTGYKSGSSLGERGKPAERVGVEAARMLIEELKSPCAVDVHVADQLIPYMALAPGSEITTSSLSEHIKTNIWVVERMMPEVKFAVETDRSKGTVRIASSNR